jgi:hypothetical protein
MHTYSLALGDEQQIIAGAVEWLLPDAFAFAAAWLCLGMCDGV